MREIIDDVSRRLDRAIHDVETRLSKLAERRKTLEVTLERMKSTKDKLYHIHWAASDTDVIESLPPE